MCVVINVWFVCACARRVSNAIWGERRRRSKGIGVQFVFLIYRFTLRPLKQGRSCKLSPDRKLSDRDSTGALICLTFLNVQIGGFTKAVAVSLLASLSLSCPHCILRAVPSPLPSTLMMLCSSALKAHPRPLARQARGLGCKARVHRLNTDTNGPGLREKPLTHAKTPHRVRDAPEAMLVSSDLDDAVRDQRHLSQFQTGLRHLSPPSHQSRRCCLRIPIGPGSRSCVTEASQLLMKA